MAITRIRKFGVLLGTGMMLYAMPASAGFELVAPGDAPSQTARQAPAQPSAMNEAPMPIIPSEPVTSEPLMPMDHVAPAAPVVNNSGNDGEPVYIRRQRTTTLVKAPVNEPMNTEVLLKATARNADIELVPQNNAAANSDGRLVINPYPLQERSAMGVHNGEGVKPSVEQAMMEQAGNLRPVAVPGQNSAVGMAERARIAGRYADGSGYLVLPESCRPQPVAAPIPSSVTMTPIPGGEDAPLLGLTREGSVSSAVAVAVPAPTSIMPRPATPQDYPAPVAANTAVNASGFTDAVGFGRDLPLPLALSQVIPAGYSYAFGQNIDLAANVSWQGGKPWDQVLNDMLAPSGMTAVIQSNQVTIQKRT